MSGSVILEFSVSADGHAHHPRVLYAIPAIVFDEAGQLVIRASTFHPRMENGVALPCSMRVRVKFQMHHGAQPLEGGDLDEKIAGTRTLAMAGDPNSQLLYGLVLIARPELAATGERTDDWFLKAAQAGVPAAQFLVGQALMSGMGFERDPKKGAAWLTRAASAGQANAQLALANYLISAEGGADSAAAIGWLEKAAAGNAEAGYHLAALLATCSDAARRNPQRALELLAEVMHGVDTDPTAYEIRAAANAALGRFGDARRDQRLAVKYARRIGWGTAPQEARLASYEKDLTWTGDLFAP